MRSYAGFFATRRILFHADSQINRFAGDSKMIVILHALISWANWKDGLGYVNGKEEVIPRGNLFTTYSELMAISGCSLSYARGAIRRLLRCNEIEILINRRGLYVKVCNYEYYQDCSKEDDRQIDRQIDRHNDSQVAPNSHPERQHQTSKQVNKETSKQIININTGNCLHTNETEAQSLRSRGVFQNSIPSDQENIDDGMRFVPHICDDIETIQVASELILDVLVSPVEKVSKKASEQPGVPKSTAVEVIPRRVKKIRTVTSTPEDIALSKKWSEYTSKNWPHVKVDEGRWAESIRKIRTATNLDHEQMKAMFEFARKDDFWNDKIQSPVGLLKKGRNDLRKVDNILSAIKRKHCKYDSMLEDMRAIDRGDMKLNTNFFEEAAQ